jgi:nitric oxide reductase activation protein
MRTTFEAMRDEDCIMKRQVYGDGVDIDALVEAKTRVHIRIADGKPDDYDTCRGEFGVEDTRRALIEARHEGIHPYCVTIDKEAKDYLPHMYGPATFIDIDEVYKLPSNVGYLPTHYDVATPAAFPCY